MPTMIFSDGPIGVISRSGTLTYEAVDQLTRQGLGQSTAVGIGGDPIIGHPVHRRAPALRGRRRHRGRRDDRRDRAAAEEEGAAFVKEHMTKPVFGFIAGRTAPPGRRMGHAGAIVSGGSGTADAKLDAMREAGITVIESPAEIGETVKTHIERASPERRARDQ
jgi:succinyl-CoA synthetase alpha subunit